MKILFATDTYPPHANGTAYFVYRLAHELALRDHTVSVVAPSQTFANTKSIDNNNVTVYGMRSVPYFNYPKFRMSPWLLLSKKIIRKIVEDTSPDIIHLQQHFAISTAVFDTAKKHKIPVIGTNHFQAENLIHYFPVPKILQDKIVNYGWNWFIKVFTKLDAVTTPTETAAEIVAGIGFNKPITVISNGISLEHFKPSTSSNRTRQTYHIPSKKPVLLFVGRLDKEKNLDVVIKASAAALKTCDFQLVIAGIGATRHQLEKLCKHLKIGKNVTFTGFIPDKDLPHLYQASDIFVIAGIAELQSIATMEAMASGLPVLAANAKALPELVHDGQNGYLFPPKSAQILSEKIIKLVTNNSLRQKMAKESLAIIKKHDIKNTVMQFEKIYREQIGRHSN